MRSPPKVIEPGRCARRLAGHLLGSGAERGAKARIVEVALESPSFLSRSRTLQKRAHDREARAACADQPLDERMRYWYMRRGLHFVHAEDP